MEYQVPQFIEVEDKIVGPLSLKQFIYLAGGAGIAALAFLYLPFLLFILVAAPVVALAAALAFYRINGKPLSAILEAAFSYYVGSKLFLWRKEETKEKIAAAKSMAASEAAAKEAEAAEHAAPRLTSGKLHELAWSLDIKKGEGEQEP